MTYVRYCLCVLAAAAVLSASAAPAAVYACKCRGITKRFLFFSVTRPCGNGYAEAQQGAVKRPLPVGQLSNYLPPEAANDVRVGGCVRSRVSGWACATVTGTGLPACLDE